MISPKLYQNSGTYGFFLRLLGYEAGISRFLSSTDVPLLQAPRILDVGCGTGLLGLHFLQLHPRATLLATDLEPGFLETTLENARRRGIDPSRIRVATADVSAPMMIEALDGQASRLDNAGFDLICMGAVIGYAKDTESSLRDLVDLLAPGGTLLNLEMSESLTGRFVSHRYHYHNVPLSRMEDVLIESGCRVDRRTLRLNHLPAKLTRTAVIARKPK